MFRLFIGVGFGVVLTILALGFAGVGHGSYVPMIFLNPLLLLPLPLPAFSILIGSILWGAYFMLIPRISTMRIRIVTIFIVYCVHLGSGIWAMTQDSAFRQSASENSIALGAFAVLLLVMMGALLYLSIHADTVRRLQ